MNTLLINESYDEWWKDNITETFYKYTLQHVINKNFIIKVPVYESFTSLLSFTTTYREHFNNKTKIYGDNYQAIMHIYDDILTTYDNSSSIKYENINKFLRDKNSFGQPNYPVIKQEVKNLFMNYICKSQKVYFAILKFIKICKIKYSKPYNIDDLCLEKIKNPCYIFHINKLYLFSKNDIINLFYNSLISSNHEFHSSPKIIKNPYINIKFNYNMLVQLYFYYKYNTISYNNVIEAFFKCDFKLKQFIADNDTMITELNIKRFLNNSNTNMKQISKFLKQMIDYTNANIIKKKDQSLSYCKLFPEKIYYQAYKPYLFQYLLFRYCSDQSKSYDSYSIFKKKIIRFHKYSPKFGRSILHLPTNRRSYTLPFITKQPKEKYFTYETKHINYYNNNYTEEHCEPVLARNVLKRKNRDDEIENNYYDSETESDTDSVETPNNYTDPDQTFDSDNYDHINDTLSNMLISNILNREITLNRDTYTNDTEVIIPVHIDANISENIQIDQDDVNVNIIQND